MTHNHISTSTFKIGLMESNTEKRGITKVVSVWVLVPVLIYMYEVKLAQSELTKCFYCNVAD